MVRYGIDIQGLITITIGLKTVWNIYTLNIDSNSPSAKGALLL